MGKGESIELAAREQIQRERVEVLIAIGLIGTTGTAARAIIATIDGLELETIDTGKVISALNIQGPVNAAWLDFLKAPAVTWPKGLDRLAKQVGLKTSGREMLAMLKKARVVH
jgi:hypothetical protein